MQGEKLYGCLGEHIFQHPIYLLFHQREVVYSCSTCHKFERAKIFEIMLGSIVTSWNNNTCNKHERYHLASFISITTQPTRISGANV